MSGLYIHIPFCKKRCIYCDFYSTTLGADVRENYVTSLCNEIRLRAAYLPTDELETIYLGGGTPSQLSPQQLEKIFTTIGRTFKIAENAEITLEANPDDLTPDYIKTLHRHLPVNRISMGVQTFDDSRLRFLNRRHTAGEALNAVRTLADEGLDNISIDLIYGLPDQTLEQWEKDISTALSLPVRHLSAYALIYEENTRLWQLREEGKAEEAGDELSLSMFRLLMDKLKAAGFDHYEISNFALPGFRARHNASYWKDVPYLGIGPAAHSFDGNSRQWNKPDITAYIKARGDVENNGLFEKEMLTETMKFNEALLKRLRTSDGLSLDYVEKNFGTARKNRLLQAARRFLQQGLLETDEKQSLLRLTRNGIFISDGIISDMFLEN